MNKKKKSIPKNQISDELVVQAVAAREKGLMDQAKKLFQDSLAHNPQNTWALFSLGQMEMDRDPVAAFQFFDRAVKSAPHIAGFWYARAKMLITLNRKKEALADFDEALTLDPKHLKALNDSAVLLVEFQKPNLALERFERILQIRPDADAISNIAMIHADFITDEALVKTVTYLEQLVAFQPDYPYAIGRLSYQKLHICDWRDYEPHNKRVLEGVCTGQRACTPFPCMVISNEAAEHQKCAQIYSETYFGRSPPPLWQGKKYQHKKIRIAYVSPDFGNHPVGQLMAGVLEHHDKSQFELIGISVFDNEFGAQRDRLAKAFDRFVDAQSLGVLGTATLMHEMEIDIAVDLAGYTRATGSPIFAHRPAPIQINFLGYPGTLGVDFMDYIVADRHVIPPEHQCFYNEKVVYLPDAYLPTDNSLAVSARTPSRAECGLPETGFVFCSFSHDHKIAPPMFDVWMRLLQQVPGSVLWLMSRLATSENNLRKEAQSRGIAPERLIFATRVPLIEDHLARYRLADLFLDTHPYNAHTTTADTLMVGLPVLTLMGNAFPSRVAGSLLHAVGLPEMITHSLSEYEALAMQLVREPARLMALRAKLAANRNTYPLFNTDLYCRNLEAIYKRLYQHQQSPSDTNHQSTDEPAQTTANNADANSLSKRNSAQNQQPSSTPPSAPPAKIHINKQASDQLLTQGVAAQEKGLLDHAKSLFQKSLEHNPNNPWTLYSLGSIEEQRNPELAFQFYDRAVKCAPNISKLLHARASILVKLSRPTEALASFDEAIALDPCNVDALNDSGVLLFELHRSRQALERFQRILQIQPHANALSNIAAIDGLSIKDDDLIRAVTSLEQLVALQPDYPHAIGRLIYQRLHICDWRDYAPSIQRVLDAVRTNQAVCTPIPMLVMSNDAPDHQRCAQSFAKIFFPSNPPPLWQGGRYQHKKIRVAYVSPDFGDHPVGQQMAGVLERHDKSQFEIIGISVNDNHKNVKRDRLVKAFDRFVEAQSMGGRETATLMHQMEIDIAVDLAGYTQKTGSPIFAHRPAPIQINFLGYPGTLGVDFMDYIVADRHVIPPEHQCFYNENVVYLPDAYLPTDNSLAISARTPSRAECNLPECGFVFCSFSHDHKIAPPMFDVWMRLLQQVPGSVLWLMSRLVTSENNLRKEAQSRGIAPERLIFATRVPLIEDHLARYRLADLFLDTHPYNAHTTTADALMVGLPVLTLMGNAFPSRVAGSLLHAIGLPEMITHSLSEYEALALQLVREPARLMALRAKLAANRNTYPLFNTDLFCRNLEAIFRRLYKHHQSPGDTSWLDAEPDKSTANHTEPNLLIQAVALQQQGYLNEAKAVLERCLAQNPQDPMALYSMGTILMKDNNLPVALNFLTNAVSKATTYAPLWFAHGLTLERSGRLEDALNSYENAIMLDPNFLKALINSCIVMQKLQRNQEAAERHQRIVELQNRQ